MKIELLAAIAAVTVIGGCAYDPPLADAIPQASNGCLASASQFGYSCTADKWMSERDQQAAQYYANLRATQPPSATTAAPASQPATTASAPAIQAPTAG